jgi:8-oxo-dGTP pyrophosphatase MutT (NUDIX family)
MSSTLRALQARLLARAQTAPPDDAIAVVMAGAQVGLTAPHVADFLARNEPRFVLTSQGLILQDEDLDTEQRSALLANVAHTLRVAGRVQGWRDELLDIRANAQAEPVAVIERAVCRTLGINTVAIHLNAFSADGGLWVARRSPHKAIDPNLWDNLVGGMVPAGESERAALAREAYEEAGLDLTGVELSFGSRIQIARSVPEGLMSETIQVFNATLPTGAAPRNIDGEVAAIEVRSFDAVVAGIERGEFTLESSLVTLDALLQRA